MRFPSPRAALTAAVTASLSLGAVTAVAMAGSPAGPVALPRFASSAPGTSVATFPTFDDAIPPVPLPDLGAAAAPPAPVPTTRAPAPRRATTAPPATRDAAPTTHADRPTATRPRDDTRGGPRRGQDDNIRTACALGYLSGPICERD
ncbi:hypothetical protein [Pseudonocardia dioxanivorans]|uniref:hypothetical protein n=1 Tax=Pseudonocardia dioxanivorans TaxID=240495 RepID=UPI00104ACF85|nr:hypothetical protein [Pseudonocardia dioxanivorans]